MASEEETLSNPTAGKRTSLERVACANAGNPVFSCMLKAKALTTTNLLTKPQAMLFKTTSSDYGAIPPTAHTVPCRYYPMENSFTEHLFICGLTQYNCINTGIEKSKVYDNPVLMNSL